MPNIQEDLGPAWDWDPGLRRTKKKSMKEGRRDFLELHFKTAFERFEIVVFQSNV
jgi:hypothetical protein